MKQFIGSEGLTMSEAQSISNLCYQNALEISNQLESVNNYSKIFVHAGQTYTKVIGRPLPENVKDLVNAKAKYHALQGYLVSAIKAKEEILEGIRKERYVPTEKGLEHPEGEQTFTPIQKVSEEYGWNQLSYEQMVEYVHSEAMAAHIGKFIHNNGVLANLRSELPNIEPVEFISLVDKERTPMLVHIHHNSSDLLKLHMEFAEQHKKYEARVNYYKAMVKNIVNTKNIEIESENSKKAEEVRNFNSHLWEQHSANIKKFVANEKRNLAIFEKEKLERIKQAAALRISIPVYFQDIIDDFRNSIAQND